MYHPIPNGWVLKSSFRYTSNSTWDQVAAQARGSIFIDVECTGSGGQGGGGNNTVQQGGSGAGSAARVPRRFYVADLVGPVSITVAGTTTGSGNEQNNGSDGSFSSFGNYLYAHGGGGGGTPSADGGAGGGALAPGQGGFDSVAKGGAPSWATSNTVDHITVGFGGACGGDETPGDNLFYGIFGGAGGGCGSSGISFKGAGALFTAGAGGGGGARTTAVPGSDGGFSGPRTDSAVNGNGGAGATGTTGLAGSSGITDPFSGLGTGGGGGGFNSAGTGGNGGDGGIPGGGGGGAGSSNSTGANSGVGGAGGRGEVVVYEWGPLASTINTQPQSQTKYVGQTATFTVSATTSGGTIHYQWKQNGSNVGTDSSSYTTTVIGLVNNGDIYTVDVTDDNGTITSLNAVLTVLPAVTLAWFKA